MRARYLIFTGINSININSINNTTSAFPNITNYIYGQILSFCRHDDLDLAMRVPHDFNIK
jgi:hypothetical protein